MENKVILFSGRYDKFHTGHLITIARLGQQYSKVIICILNNMGDFYPILEREQIIKDALEHVKGNYEVIVNRHHFATITKEQVEELPKWDIYGTGNYRCLMNMHTLGYETVSVPRYPFYAASDDVKYQKLMHFLEENGYLK
jgi:nicotinamide mononucleotide adenylyltransferase